MKGLVHIYTGEGKGKTTAAVGLGIRAYGSGLKVCMAQFLKGRDTGEIKILKKLSPDFSLYRSKQVKKFIWNMNEEELQELNKLTKNMLEHCREAVQSGDWDMVILDELMAAISSKLVSLDDVIEMIKDKSDNVELVLTGRNAPKELINLADYVSEIKPIKHPFENGVPARLGIEY